MSSDNSFLDQTARQLLKNYFPTVLVIIFFIIGCSVGIDTHSKCATAKDSKLYNNLRETLNHGLTAGITTLVVLTVIRFMGGKEPDAKYVGVSFALAGVITGGMTVGMFYKCKDDLYGDRKKALEAFAWLSLVIPILGGVFIASR
jgi:hypothetical protein